MDTDLFFSLGKISANERITNPWRVDVGKKE